MKLCKDCKHYKAGNIVEHDRCYRDITITKDLVRAEETIDGYYWCTQQREDASLLYRLINPEPCGESGKYWKVK
jgi:hypothetical protein